MADNIWSADILTAQSHFVKEGYAAFNNAISDCAAYSDRMINAAKNGRCEKDLQCPSSQACHGLFDDLLLKVKPIMEGITGLSLYPTYSYARIYAPGEILEKHTDRPSCEISCTMTLSYDGKAIWPIYFERFDKRKTKINIPVGSLVAYRGLDLTHWRNKYTEGQRQIQVFLHYVNALGIYADHIFDKRKSLNV